MNLIEKLAAVSQEKCFGIEFQWDDGKPTIYSEFGTFQRKDKDKFFWEIYQWSKANKATSVQVEWRWITQEWKLKVFRYWTEPIGSTEVAPSWNEMRQYSFARCDWTVHKDEFAVWSSVTPLKPAELYIKRQREQAAKELRRRNRIVQKFPWLVK